MCVKFPRKALTAVTVYIQVHPRARCADILEGLLALTRGALLVCGDLNAYYLARASVSINKRGCDFVSEAERVGLVLTNDGSQTFLRGAVTTSTINATLCSFDLLVNWRIPGKTEGSDNFPIDISLDGESRSNFRIGK